jgi:protein-tyrosine-phosphatase
MGLRDMTFAEFRIYVANNYRHQMNEAFEELLRNTNYEPSELAPLLVAYDEREEFDTIGSMCDLIHDALIDCQN